MRFKIRYLFIFIAIIIILGASSFFIIDKNSLSSFPTSIPDSPTAERNYKFKLSPPDPERTEGETKQMQEKLVERAHQLFKDENISIVAIGDSLTQGVGDETEQSGYIGILDRLLNKDQHVVSFKNMGKRGHRSDQLLDRLQDSEIITELKHADYVLITIGANDLMKIVRDNITNLKLQDFIEERINYQQRLEQILSKIRGVNSEAYILLVGIYNPFEKYFPHIKELDIIIDEYNHTAMTVIKDTGNGSFVPILDLFQDSSIELLADDHFHPNFRGYERIAGRVLEYILLTGGIDDDEEETPGKTE